ncbi:MAG: hypothetical protein M5U26_06890 [Planctomycetota bacterium]|nr:hypothetical protein [Planctomycetota bacterium]
MAQPASPVDPRLGAWQHELLRRAAYVLGASLLLSLVAAYLVHPFASNYDDFIYPPLIALAVAGPEGLLRRSWKVLAWSALAATIAALFGFWLTHVWESKAIETRVAMLLVALGGAMGFSAGLGARSLLAMILGLMFGQAGGWLGGLGYTAIRGSHWSGPRFVEALQIVCAMLLPIALASGLAVCLAVRWSRGQPTPNAETPS